VGRNIDKIELLLTHDPDAASKKTNNESFPLHLACGSYQGCLEVVKALFDAFPQAINVCDREGQTPFELASNLKTLDLEIINFLEAQLAYAREAKDTTVMTTPDEIGWLPLHHALKDAASLGSIKLFVTGNTAALQVADPKGVYPLHIACEFSSVKIVKYLIGELDGISMDQLDINKDTPLHYACRGRKLEVVKYLLDEHTSLVSSAGLNEEGKLPIHSLCESGNDNVDSDSTEYIEVIWRMLLANPEVIMSY